MAKTLGINIINNWLRAVVIDGSSERSWSSPKQVFEVKDIVESIRQGVKETKSKGYYLSVVMEHELLVQKTFEVPPMEKKDLIVLLKRKVAKEKGFDGEAVFSYTKTASAKGHDSVSVNMLPKAFIEELMQGALDSGVFLIQLTPLSSVMAQQFLRYDIQKDEMGALLSKMGEKIMLVIGKSDGSIFSERTLKGDMYIKEDVEKLSTEVNRSILFSKQQFGENVSLLNITETFSEEFLAMLKKSLSVPVEYIAKSGRFFWVREALKLPFGHDSNLVIPQVRKGMYVRKFTKIVAASIATLWIGALAASGFVEYMIYNESAKLKLVAPQIEKLKKEELVLEEKAKELARIESMIKLLKLSGTKQVPGWFTGYLTNVIPDGIILTKADIVRKDDAWEMLLVGKLRVIEIPIAEEPESKGKTAGEKEKKKTRKADPGIGGSPGIGSEDVVKRLTSKGGLKKALLEAKSAKQADEKDGDASEEEAVNVEYVVALDALKELVDSLRNGPYQVGISEGWYEAWLNDYYKGKLKLGNIVTAKMTSFSLKGAIQ